MSPLRLPFALFLSVVFVFVASVARANIVYFPPAPSSFFTPLDIKKKMCFAWVGPCVWFPVEYAVPITVKAPSHAVLDVVKWKATVTGGGQIASGSLPTPPGTTTVSGTLDPFGGAIITTDCGTFLDIHYTVTVRYHYTDTPLQLSGQAVRTYTRSLHCVPCSSDPYPLRPYTNGPHRVPLRFLPYPFWMQFGVLNASERFQTATVEFASTVPWLVFDGNERDVTIPPGQGIDFQMPVKVLPGAAAGSVGFVSITVVPIDNPEAKRTITTKVKLIDPAAGECILSSADCFEPHEGGSCDNPDCCETVCAVDPVCCSLSWDEYCVSTAGLFCGNP